MFEKGRILFKIFNARSQKDALSIAHLLANVHHLLLAHRDLSWKHLSLISNEKNTHTNKGKNLLRSKLLTLVDDRGEVCLL